MKQPTEFTRSEALALMVYLHRMSAKEIAEACGVTRQAIENSAAGYFDLSDETLTKVARYIGVSPHRVLSLPKGAKTNQ